MNSINPNLKGKKRDIYLRRKLTHFNYPAKLRRFPIPLGAALVIQTFIRMWMAMKLRK